MKRLAVLLLCLVYADPAHAGPLAALVPVVVGIAGKALALSAIAKIALTIAATAAMSMLNKNKKPRNPGITIETTLQGGTNSRTILLGLYATAGSEATPPMSYGQSGKTPNSRLVKVIACADVAVDGLSRIIINGEYVPLTSIGGGKYNLGGKYSGKGTVTFYDGRQTTADPTLVGALSSYPNRPWTSQRVGVGVCYAIFEFFYDADLYKGEPTVRLEIRGMRLYDPRKDSTAGGSGSHRWGQPATYEFTVNNMVMVYNILRGIPLADGSVYGGDRSAAQLPFTNWVAAMNACDATVTTSAGSEPAYRAGYEIMVDDEPADVIEELLKACSGQIVESAGTYKVRVGPAGLPVMFITDDDFFVSKAQDLDPFPAINGSCNTVNAVFPHPGELWQQHDAPQLQSSEYLARDNGQELIADLQFPAAPYPLQVQRIMRYWLQDDQRWRQHTGTLSHRAFALEPLDTIAWTSARNGYIDKLFEIGMADISLYNLSVAIAMREVDPDDYDWNPGYELPDSVSPGSWELPAVQAVPGFAVAAWSIKDGDSDARRPAIRCTWDPEGAVDAMALRIEVRVAATAEPVCGVTVGNIDAIEEIVSEGILPSTSYEVRARWLVDRPTEWTVWHGVTTGNILLTDKDFDFDALVEALGPSVVIPQITQPAKNAIIQSIIDAAYYDFERVNVNTMFNSNVAAINTEQTTRLTADDAFTQQLTFQVSRIDANQSAISAEAITRANADTAIALSVTNLTSTVSGNTAAISAEAITRANADSILASNITTVTGRLNNAGGTGVTVEQAFIAQGNSIDGLEGQYTLRINVDGRVSGFGLASGGAGSEFSILADRFIVVDPANNSTTAYPFQVVGGAVYIRKALIQQITADQINVDDLQAVSATIGDLDIRPTNNQDGRIRIFDEDDDLRVIIGRLN